MNMIENRLAGPVLLLLMGALLLWPQQVQQAAWDALCLCGRAVVPSLLPFLMLSSLFIRCGGAGRLAKYVSPLTRLLFRLPSWSAIPFTLGLLCGYPVGAMAIAQLYEQGQCSRQAAERMLPFCNNAGPAFVIGSVGAGMLGSPTLGWLLYGTHVAGAVLTGIVLSCTLPPQNFQPTPSKHAIQPLLPAFIQAVEESAIKMLRICALILLFAVLVRILQVSGLCSLICGALAHLLPWVPLSALQSMVIGAIEMSTGISNCTALGADPVRLLMAEMMLSFGGLCVLCQVASVVCPLGLSLRPYLIGKLLTCALSTLMLYVILSFQPALLATFSFSAPTIFYIHPLMTAAVLLLLFLCMALVLCVPYLILHEERCHQHRC